MWLKIIPSVNIYRAFCRTLAMFLYCFQRRNCFWLYCRRLKSHLFGLYTLHRHLYLHRHWEMPIYYYQQNICQNSVLFAILNRYTYDLTVLKSIYIKTMPEKLHDIYLMSVNGRYMQLYSTDEWNKPIKHRFSPNFPKKFCSPQTLTFWGLFQKAAVDPLILKILVLGDKG